MARGTGRTFSRCGLSRKEVPDHHEGVECSSGSVNACNNVERAEEDVLLGVDMGHWPLIQQVWKVWGQGVRGSERFIYQV